MGSDPHPFHFECLTRDALLGDPTWWEIYDEAFPRDEREPREVILESVLKGIALAIRARRADETIGLAVVHLLQDPAAVFLVYLAVAGLLRGRRIGESLLEYGWQRGVAALQDQGRVASGLIWEVDIPGRAVDAEERWRRERRIAFFRRMGGVILNRSYAQPPLWNGTAVPMYLMYRPAAGRAAPDPAEIEALVRAVYLEKYGAANGIATSLLEILMRG